MNKRILLSIFTVFCIFSLLGIVTASSPDIEEFYATPEEPYQYEDFDIYVRAEDNDGIEKMKLYRDGIYIDSYDCDGYERCSYRFELYESDYGYTTYKVKVYDEEGETETDSIRVYIQRADYHPYPDYYAQITNAYFIPSSVRTGQGFSAYLSAYSSKGVDRIEIWHGGARIAKKECYTTSCSASFTINPKYNQGIYQYTFKAVDEYGRTNSVIRSINIQEPYIPVPVNTAPRISYVTINPINPIEGQSFSIQVSASDSQGLSRIELMESGLIIGTQSCSGTSCNVVFTQPSRSSGSHVFTIRAVDSQGLVTSTSKTFHVSQLMRMCYQLGGVCCSGEGSGRVRGSSDCPNDCYISCSSGLGSGSTDGGSENLVLSPNIVLSAGSGSFLLFVGSLIVFFLLIIFASTTLRR
jgi:hypothetical protein